MANYLSKPTDYGNYTQPINLDLVNFVLQGKQQKYDYNLAKIEDKISNELGQLDLVRTEDKEYFLNRANEVMSSMGNIAKLDYSQNGVERQFSGRLESIVDERVLDDVVSTNNYRSFQGTLQQAQSGGKGAYNTLNASFAMEKYGVNSWLEGNSKALGSVAYNDYYNIQEEIEEIEDNLDRYVDVKKVHKRDGSGYYFIDYNSEILSEEKVKRIVRSKLSEPAKKQMQINSWGATGGRESNYTKTVEQFKAYGDSELKTIDKTIATINLEMEKYKNTNDGRYEELEANKTAFENHRGKLKSRFDKYYKPEDNSEAGLSKLNDNMSYEMYEGRLMNAIGERNKKNRETDFDRTLDKVRYDVLKAVTDKKEATEEAGKGTPFTISDSNLDNVDSLTGLREDINTNDTSFKLNINKSYNSLNAEHKKLVDDAYDEEAGISIEKHRYNSIKKIWTSLEGDEGDAFDSFIRADNSLQDKNNYQTEHDDLIDAAFKEKEEAITSSIITSYAGALPTNLKVTNFNGEEVSYSDLFKLHGITEENPEILNSDGISPAGVPYKDIKKRMLESFYADKITNNERLEGFKEGFDKLRVKAAKALGNRGIISFGEDAQENQQAIQDIENKVYKVSDEKKFYRERLVQLLGSEEGANIAIKESEDRKPFYSSPFLDEITDKLPDYNISQDATLDNWITKEGVEEIVKGELNDKYLTGRNKGRTYPTASKEGLALLRLVSNVDSNYENVVYVKSQKELSINVLPYDSDFVRVRVLKPEKGKTPARIIDSKIRIDELPQNIINNVNFNTNRTNERYDLDKITKKSGTAVYATQQSDALVNNVAKFLGGDVSTAALVEKDETLQQLERTYGRLLGSGNNPTPLRTGIEKAMDDSALSYHVNKINGQFYGSLNLMVEGKDIGIYSNSSTPIMDGAVQGQLLITDYAPQIGVFGMLLNSLGNYNRNSDSPSAGIKHLIEYGAN